MTLSEFLAEIVRTLETTSINYMIGGSVASSIFPSGRPSRRTV